MVSSIGKLFTKEHYQPKPEGSTEAIEGKECFPCTAISAVLMLGLGGAFSSGMVFNHKEGIKSVKHSLAYVRTVRGIGFALIPLGLYRSWRAWELYNEEYRSNE